jgi:hypothetical protein
LRTDELDSAPSDEAQQGGQIKFSRDLNRHVSHRLEPCSPLRQRFFDPLVFGDFPRQFSALLCHLGKALRMRLKAQKEREAQRQTTS